MRIRTKFKNEEDHHVYASALLDRARFDAFA
jgi:hypothetical protein